MKRIESLDVWGSSISFAESQTLAFGSGSSSFKDLQATLDRWNRWNRWAEKSSEVHT